VQHIEINPLNPNSVLAATSEGLYRSYDAGATWTLIHTILMAADIDYIPGDTNTYFVTYGNQSSTGHGIYRTLDAGATFTKLTSGLPSTFGGKALIGTSSSSPNIVYASIGEQFVQNGLYKSTDYGSTWTLMSTEDVCKWQGWYSHDVAVHPTNPDEIIFVGIDAWKSTNSGTTLNQKSYWFNWNFNATPVGGPEGPPDYCHADIHRVYYSPQSDSIIYYATDGGVFRSTDYGETFEGCNGMYHCTQFYSNIACSATDSLFVMGGMQDNATTIYEGNPSWRRVIGGDGLSTAVNQSNDLITYGSFQYLGMRKSTDKAVTFNSLSNLPAGGSYNTNFAGPYELSRSNPNVLYAGRDQIYKSTDEGDNWSITNAPINDPYLAIEISPISESIVFASSAPSPYNSSATVDLLKTLDGGNTWLNITNTLPNRYITDIAADYVDTELAYVVCSGYGTPHFFKTTDGGATWLASASGLPDVPTNSVFIDPLNSLIIYVGNDLGVYVSIDGGDNFFPWVDGLNDATMVMSMAHTASNRMLRIGTHGKGIYQRYLLDPAITSVETADEIDNILVYPNPVNDLLSVEGLEQLKNVRAIVITDAVGRVVLSEDLVSNDIGNKYSVDVSELARGSYAISLVSEGKRLSKVFIKE
ncbi:MAG: T9SS type A sorting domain-containing protein, partial [Bacteroidia bacterium]|nr:T9SS type A sorting domain-containing protein [Bacteroidia bacterium]